MKIDSKQKKTTTEQVHLLSIKLKVLNNIINIMAERTVIKVKIQILLYRVITCSIDRHLIKDMLYQIGEGFYSITTEVKLIYFHCK